MLVHICCSVDSHYFLQKLRQDYPDERLVGFFYDPNIHPYSEYYLRLLDVKRSCKMLGIELIEGEYDVENWLEAVRGLEHEPEKGARCAVCFDRRFEVTAQKAAELGHDVFTSTLLTSPKKSLQQLRAAGDALATRYGIRFVAPDYRKASGTQEQNKMAKEDKLYRQDYCGCIFGLTMQREQQRKLADELFMPIGRQIQPESIEARVAMYERRWQLEEQGKAYTIVKERFLNWRLKRALLHVRKTPVAAHILPYSTIKGNYTRGRIDAQAGRLHYMNRDEVKFISLETYNELSDSRYESVTSLIFDPPAFEAEVALRRRLIPNPYDLSAIVVVETIPDNKIELWLDSETYEDVQERLIETI